MINRWPRFARLTLTTALFLVLLSGCTIGTNNMSIIKGSGNVIVEPRDVSNLGEVVLTMSADLDITQGSAESLKIEGEDNIIPLITTEINGERLTIGVKDNSSFSNTRPLRIYLTAKELSYVQATGSGSIKIAGMRGEKLHTEASGSGSITATDLAARDYTATLTGSGDISAQGSAENLTVNCSGSGSFSGPELQGTVARVEVSGSGSATVRVSKSLDATVSGSGSIRYVGSPEVTRHDSGSGEIEQIK